jgi:hypothetical protein
MTPVYTVFRYKKTTTKTKEKVTKIVLLLFFSGKTANRSKIPKPFFSSRFFRDFLHLSIEKVMGIRYATIQKNG